MWILFECLQVAAANLEIDLMKRRRQEELDAIDGRIRLVVAKKDAQVTI